MNTRLSFWQNLWRILKFVPTAQYARVVYSASRFGGLSDEPVAMELPACDLGF